MHNSRTIYVSHCPAGLVHRAGKVRLGLQAWAAENLQDPQRFGLEELDSVSAGLRYKILTYVLLGGSSD